MTTSLHNQRLDHALGYLALAHHYAQRSLPGQAFAGLLGLNPTRLVELTSVLPELPMDLLVSPTRGVWRTAHDLVALEVLRQLLWPSSSDRRLWRQNLSTWTVKFAEMCRGTSPVPSEEMAEVARRTFIYRDNVELLGTERSANRQFAQLLEDIPSKEGAALVLRRLTDLYPDEPHFWAHLGRFYSLEMESYIQARECIDRALELNERDSVLHHMKGMTLRKLVYQYTDDRKDLAEVLEIAKQSSASFGRARELNPDDEHGYISEVQLLTKVLDYAGRQHGTNPVQFLNSGRVDPWLRDCFERAEDLLEQVRGNREGQGASHYEQECRANIDLLYGRHGEALQTWDNLLTRQDVYRPPLRRQIVWTYLARNNRVWDNLSPKEADRSVELLEENLREEPGSDTNLRMWVQAVRRATRPPSLESVLERVIYWKAAADSLESAYYLFVFYALQVLENSSLAVAPALRALEECRLKSRFRRNRSISFEWLGEGAGISALVHHSLLGEWNKNIEFWDRPSRLKRISGRIKNIEAPQAGFIQIDGGLA